MSDETKCCLTCGKTKPVLAFPKSGRLGGIQRYRADCKDCLSEELRTLRGSFKAHHENVVTERCPHGPGVRKFAWVGYRG